MAKFKGETNVYQNKQTAMKGVGPFLVVIFFQILEGAIQRKKRVPL